jgi:imidazole glycerol-phosphate synthase subunit HisF
MKDQSPKPDMFLGASAHQFQMAKTLRANETEAERVLWSKLSGKQLGVKFRRQHPLHDFIVDFYCHYHRLVIEVDGAIHQTSQNQSYDESRSEAFTSFGIKTIRFSNEEVINHTDTVITSIKNMLTKIPPSGGQGAE